jgi:protein-disulfide isomerase
MTRWFAIPLLCSAWAAGQTLSTLNLQDAGGSPVSLNTAGKITAVVFVSTKCPVSNDYNDRMTALYKDYAAKGVQFVFVNSNQNESGGEVAQHAKDVAFPFTVYKDLGNKLADQFKAEVTPHAYILGKDSSVIYRGAIDDARNAARVTRRPLREALDAALSGKPAPSAEAKAFGCSIKRIQT